MTQFDPPQGGKRLRLGTRGSPLALAQAHQNGGDDQAVAARHGPWWQSPGRIAFHGWVPAAAPSWTAAPCSGWSGMELMLAVP